MQFYYQCKRCQFVVKRYHNLRKCPRCGGAVERASPIPCPTCNGVGWKHLQVTEEGVAALNRTTARKKGGE